MISKERRTPYDGTTGLPYLTEPTEEILVLGDPLVDGHHIAHGKEALLAMGLRGRAMRCVQVQLLPSVLHKGNPDSYHETFIYSKVPQSEIGAIRYSMFGAYLAIGGKLLLPGGWGTRPTTQEDRERLWRSGELGPEFITHTYKFLRQFAIKRGIDHLTRADIVSYDNLVEKDEKRAAIDGLLARFSSIAFEPIESRYEEAKGRGLMPEDSPVNATEAGKLLIMKDVTRFNEFDLAFQIAQGRMAA